MMKINIALLKANREADIEEDIETKTLFSEKEGVLNLHAKIHTVYTPEIAVVTGTLYGMVKKTCNRCLEIFDKEYTCSFEQTYEIDPFDEEIILDEDIRQTFLLCLPMKNICKISCKGLCPVCGENRNNTQCDCETNSRNTPFDKLRKLLKR